SYCPGVPISVAVLMGPAGNIVLSQSYQSLSQDHTFLYLGGQVPINDELVERAQRLAHRVAAVLPGGVGYVGLDMVLGEDAQQDVLIEVNPRLTTSYVGLSALVNGNLAEGILRVAEGLAWPVSFKSDPVRFDASGRIMAAAMDCTCPGSP
ncbi:MAG: ATP-grasp domain-containing protein, partial [Planctomycetaceae bacterium]|nr:ATP-grasp domain-containing protein [Planctomycetaceae bacterium]